MFSLEKKIGFHNSSYAARILYTQSAAFIIKMNVWIVSLPGSPDILISKWIVSTICLISPGFYSAKHIYDVLVLSDWRPKSAPHIFLLCTATHVTLQHRYPWTRSFAGLFIVAPSSCLSESAHRDNRADRDRSIRHRGWIRSHCLKSKSWKCPHRMGSTVRMGWTDPSTARQSRQLLFRALLLQNQLHLNESFIRLIKPDGAFER